MGSSYLITDKATSNRLGKMPQCDTSIEEIVRKELHSQGLRFRIRNRDLPGSPDIANRRRKWVVFVHGCYWHHHKGCNRATIPKRNSNFWISKFRANRARDKRAIHALRALGYYSFIIWECEIRGNPDLVQRKIAKLLQIVESTATPDRT